MKKHLKWVVVLAGLLSVSAPAQSLFEWSFTTTGGNVDGSGNLIAVGDQVTQMTGTYLGQTIDGLGGGFGGPDNLLMNLTGAFDQIDLDGITFEYGAGYTQENFFSAGNDSGAAPDLEYGNRNYGVFSATPLPESPVNPGLLAAAGLFAGWRSWRARRVARA